ncbi:hypothetical protein [Deinococcus cellulosilyticus]|uniref:Uncharacterized protein n=1 Tax=Deinococcus cellulosilyticus (strain DSM 18568 / NBRC 106333 / KACC 11606 / 5516J-15) TaxID=1223518 RepID=A0A511N439_DEIC1|nr:hypothetical protein [Deinococcus cellulosilyticus]GEM47644.1 hypothetical protein DC3_32790 [Deinococcus cellulosilyticus NBRC 106333 = KACC 11606]
MKRLINELVFMVGPLVFVLGFPLIFQEKPAVAVFLLLFSGMGLTLRFWLYVSACTETHLTLRCLWMVFQVPNVVVSRMPYPVGSGEGLLVSFQTRSFPKGLLFTPYTVKSKTVLNDLIQHQVIPEVYRDIFYIR